MARVYAWKLVCDGKTIYSYLTDGGTYYVDNCGDIPEESSSYASGLTETQYEEAFNRMKAGIPEKFRNTLEDYSTYWEITEPPCDWISCDDTCPPNCNAVAKFLGGGSVTIQANQTQFTVGFEALNGSPVFTYSGIVTGATPNGNVLTVFTSENLDPVQVSGSVTMTISKKGCGDVTAALEVVQNGAECDLDVKWTSSHSVNVVASQTAYAAQFSFEPSDATVRFEHSGIVTGVTRNGNTVTIEFPQNESTGATNGSVTIFVSASASACQGQEVNDTIIINQEGKPKPSEQCTCSFSGGSVGPNGGQVRVNYTTSCPGVVPTIDYYDTTFFNSVVHGGAGTSYLLCNVKPNDGGGLGEFQVSFNSQCGTCSCAGAVSQEARETDALRVVGGEGVCNGPDVSISRVCVQSLVNGETSPISLSITGATIYPNIDVTDKLNDIFIAKNIRLLPESYGHIYPEGSYEVAVLINANVFSQYDEYQLSLHGIITQEGTQNTPIDVTFCSKGTHNSIEPRFLYRAQNVGKNGVQYFAVSYGVVCTDDPNDPNRILHDNLLSLANDPTKPGVLTRVSFDEVQQVGYAKSVLTSDAVYGGIWGGCDPQDAKFLDLVYQNTDPYDGGSIWWKYDWSKMDMTYAIYYRYTRYFDGTGRSWWTELSNSGYDPHSGCGD